MRKKYIQNQKTDLGRKVLAVLPIHYPKEILTAMDVLAVELWGPPGNPVSHEAGRLQTYVCALARNALAFLASGNAEAVDGALFPHTCDSIQGLATLAPDFGGWDKKTFRFIHPKGEFCEAAKKFVTAELKDLAKDLERLTGKPLAAEKLLWAIDLHRRIDALRGELLAGRARLSMDDRAFYALLRRGEFLWPEDHLEELRRTVDSMEDGAVQKGVPVMITGIVPEPMSILDKLNEAGAFVAGDDYAAVGRRVVREKTDPEKDPFARLTDLSFAAPPCSTRSADQQQRMAHLSEVFEQSKSAGVIIHAVKFCEPELFDVPAIKKTFASRGVPVLYLESELEAELSGQALTRIEAFAETVVLAGRSG